MKKSTILLLALAALLAMLAIGGGVLAQSSASYNLEWHVIGGGGQPVASANYAVNSTVGQGAASPPYSASSSYVVSGGYWFIETHQIYLPLVTKS
jgi:ABC-type glycerol-3-phosphate transport system substrate-binding protein